MRRALAVAGILLGYAGTLPAEEIDQAGPAVQNQIGERAIGRQDGNFNQIRHRNVSRHSATERAVHPQFSGPMTAAKIQRAIDDAIVFLRSGQQADGSLREESNWQGGTTALAALAMLASGADPESDDSLKRALDWLLKCDMDATYVRGIRANVWEYALRKCPYDERFSKALKADYEWLMKALGSKEGWRYTLNSGDWDNSVTQYGVLGVWAARRAGLDPGDGFWERMSKHFRSCQNPDGGWGYQQGGSSANMATAGLATMFLVFDMYHGKNFYRAQDPYPFSEGAAAECLKSISRGMDWLAKSGGANNDSYYLYGIERTGVASGRKYIGGHDWFAEGADVVLKQQQQDGAVAMSGHGGAIVRTAFSTLFLVYGGAPPAFNKLEYGTNQDWNLNPRDLANLTREMWSAYEKPLNWHSVSISAPVEEFEAPILFISGSKEVKFSEAETAKLRAYVDRGGTILAEPSDRSAAFRESMIRLLGEMYPQKEYPARELKPIPADHGLYAVLKQSWTKRPVLLGASDGPRIFFVLSEDYMSADWQLNKTDSDAFKLAMNLLFYATDLGELSGRFASILPQTPPAAERQTSATIARVKFAGAGSQPRDWEAGAVCWKSFAPYFRHVTGAKLVEKPAVDLAADDLKGITALHITGRQSLSLSARDHDALKKFVEAGGTLLVDAYAGSKDFAASARKEIETVFGKLQPLADSHMLAAGRFSGGVDLSRGMRYTLPARRVLRDRAETCNGQKLQVVTVKNRPAVIFSDFDITAAVAGISNFGAVGYRPDSARKIVGNILAYACAD